MSTHQHCSWYYLPSFPSISFPFPSRSLLFRVIICSLALSPLGGFTVVEDTVSASCPLGVADLLTEAELVADLLTEVELTGGVESTSIPSTLVAILDWSDDDVVVVTAPPSNQE